MYTMKQQTEDEYYSIYAPDGDYICDVIGYHDAVKLLSHLNRKI